MRAALAAALMLAALVVSGGAAADPTLECRVLAGDDIDLRECLRTQLDISSRAMMVAQESALGAARELDERAGSEGAVLGVEGAQHAWEAYRDVECRTLGLFAGEGAPAEVAQLACEIRLTRARTDDLLRFGARDGG